jgi:hypothetical protein
LILLFDDTRFTPFCGPCPAKGSERLHFLDSLIL